MTPVPLILQVFLAVGVVMLGLLAWAFWRDPVRGMAAATHRPELLPQVMADRYAAVAVIALGLIFFGSPEMIAVFFAAGAVMGLGDGAIYARAGHPHIKHTATGILSLIALAVTLGILAQTGGSV